MRKITDEEKVNILQYHINDAFDMLGTFMTFPKKVNDKLPYLEFIEAAQRILDQLTTDEPDEEI